MYGEISRLNGMVRSIEEGGCSERVLVGGGGINM